MAFWSEVRAIAVKETTILVRDRQALRLLFVMPAVFILFLSLALSEVYTEKIGTTLKVVLDNRDGQRFSILLARNLRSVDELEILTPEQVGNTEEALGRGEVKAIITIPEGFSSDLQDFLDSEGLAPFGPNAVAWQADPTLDASYRWFIESTTALCLLQSIFDDLVVTEAQSADRDRPRMVVPAPTDGAEVVPTPLQQTVPGWSLFAMFFIAVPLSASFIKETDSGTLERLMTYRVSRAAVVLGKLAPYFVVNLVQFSLMLAVGTLVMPLISDLSLQLGHSPSHLVAVTVVSAFAATGFGVLLASICRTADQASALGAISIIIMAVIGGVMVPHFVMPRVMQTLAYASPLYWGHQAYLDVLLRSAPFPVLAGKLTVLLVFALCSFGAATWRLRSSWP